MITNQQATFGSLPLLGVDAVIRRGTRPGRFRLRLPHDAALDVGVGNLVLTSDATVTFANCVPDLSTVRCENIARDRRDWVLVVYDRRQRWARTPIGGNYNIRLRDNTLVTASKKTAEELAKLALAAAGETTTSTYGLPAVYPPGNWTGTTVSEALDALCSVVPEHVVRTATDFYEMALTGSGSTISDLTALAQWAMLPDYLARVDTGPKTIKVRCGPTWFMCGLELDGVSQEAHDGYETLASVSYRPASGWGGQWPPFLSGVAAASRALALESAFRTYRVKVSQDLAFEVDSTALSLTSRDDIQLDTQQVLFGATEQPPALINGTFYPYSDHYENVGTCPVQSSWFRVDNELCGIRLEYPLWKVGSSNDETEAADLKLYTGFHMRDPDTGDWYRETFEIERDTGTGELTIDMPFLWRAWSFTPDGCSDGNEEDNYDDLETEANTFLAAWKTHFDAERDKRFMPYAGTHAIALTGNIAELTYRLGRGLIPQTTASQHYHQSTMRD